jgi:hypothetical protein
VCTGHEEAPSTQARLIRGKPPLAGATIGSDFLRDPAALPEPPIPEHEGLRVIGKSFPELLKDSGGTGPNNDEPSDRHGVSAEHIACRGVTRSMMLI